MHLALALAALLAVDDVGAPTDVPPPAPEEKPAPKDPHPRLIGFSIGAVALGAGAALGAWFDRDGVFGRACAIGAATLGAAFFATGVVYLIAWLAGGGAHQHGTPESAVTARSAAIAAAVAGLVGLVGGAVGSAFASAPPGTPRGVLGVAGGGVMAATGVTVLIAAW